MQKKDLGGTELPYVTSLKKIRSGKKIYITRLTHESEKIKYWLPNPENEKWVALVQGTWGYSNLQFAAILQIIILVSGSSRFRIGLACLDVKAQKRSLCPWLALKAHSHKPIWRRTKEGWPERNQATTSSLLAFWLSIWISRKLSFLFKNSSTARRAKHCCSLQFWQAKPFIFYQSAPQKDVSNPFFHFLKKDLGPPKTDWKRCCILPSTEAQKMFMCVQSTKFICRCMQLDMFLI